MRFDVLTRVTLFYDVTPCMRQNFADISLFSPKDGDNVLLRTVSKLLYIRLHRVTSQETAILIFTVLDYCIVCTMSTVRDIYVGLMSSTTKTGER